MLLMTRGLFCCGIDELHRIQNYTTSESQRALLLKDVLKSITVLRNPTASIGGFTFNKKSTAKARKAFVVFTTASKRNNKENGPWLAKTIKEKGWGDVVYCGKKRNPNSSSVVNMWVWRIEAAKVCEARLELGA